MATLFISDLHLEQRRPELTLLFERYLTCAEVRQADALYILGDLVEAWIGDDDDNELSQRIATATLAVHKAGVPVYFMAGNRDFLVGMQFAQRAGLEVLEDGTVHTLYGQPTLLMHGDLLCTDDVDYQRMRQQIRTTIWQEQFLAMPLPARQSLALHARQESKKHSSNKSEALMDVNQEAVENTMRNAKVKYLIHGHTHRPAIHSFMLDGQSAERVVLGDWHAQGSVLRLSAQRRELCVIDE